MTASSVAACELHVYHLTGNYYRFDVVQIIFSNSYKTVMSVISPGVDFPEFM